MPRQLEALASNTSLQDLSLQGTGATDQSVACLARTLGSNKTLKTVWLGRNPVDGTTVPALLDAVAGTCTPLRCAGARPCVRRLLERQCANRLLPAAVRAWQATVLLLPDPAPHANPGLLGAP